MKIQGISSQTVHERAESDFEKRQISGILEHLAALHPFFQGIRGTLKVLTQHINPQWEVKTPTTPVKMQHGKSSGRG